VETTGRISFIYTALNNLGHVLLPCRSCPQVHKHISHLHADWTPDCNR